MHKSLDRPIRKFNPGTLQSDAEVIEQFVVRKRELDIVLEVLRGNIDASSCQHVLLVAPRGRGKSMLLARVGAALRTDERLSQRLLPVRFMEESQEVFNLADFWLESLFHLARESKTCAPELARELHGTHAALAAQRDQEAVAERARAAVLGAADRLGKQLVLMVENLQALSKDVDEDFGWQLRQTLQSEPQIVLLATAISRFKGLDEATQAFFELFRIVALEPLDIHDCRRLWHMVSGDAVNGREIRPLQILTGGSPRLLVIVGDFARHRSLRQLMEELVQLIDDHTEYFRSHLEVLAKTERRVYLAAIDLWQPSSTSEIAARARMDVRPVSTMLGRLVERGAVVAEGTGRKRRYAAAERLYCIYYKLRRERDEAAVVHNLIRFMAVFYSDDELRDLLGKLRLEARQSLAIREGMELAKALNPQLGSVLSVPSQPTVEPVVNQGLEVDQGQSVTASAFLAKAHHLTALGKSAEAIATYDAVVERFGASDAPGIQVRVAMAMVNKGLTLGLLDESAAQIATYDAMVERFGASDTPEIQVQVAKAMFYKGITQGQLDESEAAIAAYDAVVERFGASDAPEIRVQVAKAMLNRGFRQSQLDESEAAIATYDAVVERFGPSDAPEIQVQVAMAMFNKGFRQGQLDESEAAIATYDAMVERFGASDAPEIQVQVAMAMFNKGFRQGQLDESEAAIAACDAVVERFGASDAPEIQVQVAKAMFNKGFRQGQLDESEAAIATYDAVVERFGASDAPEIQVQVAMAMVNKGVRQGALDESATEIATYDAMVERFGASDTPEIQVEVARAMFYKGITQGQLDESAAEIATYDAMVARFGASDAPEIQVQVAKAMVNRGVRQGQLDESEAAIATYDAMVERFGASDTPEIQVQVAKAMVNKGITQGQLDESAAEIATYDAVVERFGASDAPEIQVQVAKAMVNKGITQGQLDESAAEIATYDAVVERFGASDAPEIQVQVAKAMVNKGITQGQLDESAAEIATYDAVVERFGASDAPEVRVQVAKAMFNKGVTHGQLDESEAAIAAYDAVVERFGASDTPELQMGVAMSMVNKAERHADLGDGRAALETCDELERRLGALTDADESGFEWWIVWLRAKAFLVQENRSAAVEAFRAVYALFVPGKEAMMREMLARVPGLIAVGASEHDLLEVLSADRQKADTLAPLVVALRQLAGESVRAPAEVLEVAADVRERIEAQKRH